MKKRMVSFLLIICMIMTMMPALGSTVEASTAQDARFDKILNPGQPTGFVKGDTTDPYMKGQDQPFLLSEQDEALLYQQYNPDDNDTNKRGTVSQTVGNTYKKGNVVSAISRTDNQPLNMAGCYKSNETLAEGPQDMAYVSAVSFDPTGSGRKDHVAYVGYSVTNQKIETWVMDAKGDGNANAIYSEPVALSDEISNAWIKLNQYTYRAFFTITAGDYNGDHKDSYVVYCPGTDTIDPQLYEFTLQSGSYRQTEKIDVVGDKLYNESDMNQQKPIAKSSDGNKSYIQMLTMSLTTGDFDGDNIDELGAACGTYRLCGDNPNNIRGSWVDKATYTTQVSIMDQNNSAFSQTTKFDLVDQTEDSTQPGVFHCQMLYAGQITAGDVDGDGQDEIVAVGSTGKADFVQSESKWYKLYERDGSNNATATISYDNGKYNRTELNLVEMNGFTKAHVDNEKDTWPVSAIVCVSINGASAADDVFLSGTLYTDTEGKLTSAFEPRFFNAEDNLTVISVQDHWVDSVTVGNFDGNDAGRQQVMFSICEKDKDKNNYLYKVAILGGDKYSDSYDQATNKLLSYGTVSTYYYSNLKDDGCKMYNGGRGNAWWDKTGLVLNCVPVAIDNDDDGVMARYAGKGYVYSDPAVLAVLQAAPYFGELGGYSTFGGATSYSVTTSYTYGKTSSENISFGFGFSGETSVDLAATIKVAVEAGYTLDWSKSFEHSLTTSYTSTFSAGPYDQVIVQRTPALVYCYNILRKVDGIWSWSTVTYQFTVPLQPTYTQLSVSEYNAFVDYYTGQYNQIVTGSNKDDTVLLKKLTSDLLPEDDAGNPAAYRNNWTPKVIGSGTTSVSDYAESLSKGQYTLGHSGGSLESQWSVQSDDKKEITTAHGFHFGLTVQAGVDFFGTASMAGAYTNLDYDHGTGYYHTTTKAAGASGTIGNIDSPALAGRGIPENVSNAYSFTWSFGKWQADLGGLCFGTGVRDANKNPLFDSVQFFGYAVDGIAMPPAPVTDLKAVLASDSSADLSWTAPSIPAYLTRPIDGYYIYQVKDGIYTQLNTNLVTETSYTVTGLDESSTDYSYVVCSYHDGDTSCWSNVATVTTPKKYYTLTFKGNASATAGYEGVSVSNGEKCPENTILYINAKSLNGYSLIGYKIGDNPEVTFDPCESKSFNFNFPSKNTTVEFETQQVSSDIRYQSNDNNAGSVTASVGGIQLDGEGTVSDVVTLQATPNSGYVLKDWNIDDGSNTTTVSDDGSGILVLNPVKSSYSIMANFKSTSSSEVLKTVTVNTPEFGSIVITDSSNKVLTPNSNNQISVVLNTSLKFKAIPAELYSLKGWTGDLSGTTNPQTVLISDNITVGADFSAPVKYSVTYESNPTEGGTISAKNGTTPVMSGSAVAKGSSLKFSATPNVSYVFTGWTVDDSANSSAADKLVLTITKKTKIEAAFTETCTISATAGTGGTISPSGTSTIKVGETLTYYIVPAYGYEITDVKVDGASVGKLSSYSFLGANGSHTIAAEFKQMTTPPVTPPVTPVTPSTPTTYTVPANSDVGNTNVDTTVSGDTATISPTAEQKAAVTSSEKSTGTVEIDLTGANVNTTVVPSDFVEAVQKAKESQGIEVAMPTGSLALDKTALDSVGQGNDVKMTVKTVDKTNLNTEQQNKLTEALASGAISDTSDVLIVDAGIFVNGTETHTFNNGNIKISIPYTLKEGEDANKITVWYLADDGTLTAMHGTYDAKTKRVSFTTQHLSSYAVGAVSEDRLSGKNRYDTMAEIAAEAFPDGSDAAILASGANFPDALAASSLAGALSCPIILTKPDALSSQAAALLKKLGTTKVYIVGSNKSVSDQVTADLVKGGIAEASVLRIGGINRVETAEMIAQKTLSLVKPDTCIIACGRNFPDALSISSYAYKNTMPILLTGSGDKLTEASLAIAKGFKKAIIVGSSDSVSSEVEGQLTGLAVTRYGGANRYETSRKIIDGLYGNTVTTLAIATGKNFPDALAGASVAGKAGGAILLVNGAGTSLAKTENAVIAKANRSYVLGGTPSVSEKVEDAVIDAMK